MTDNDDNPLAGIDLAAWQPPAPGDGLADAVVARMREPVPAVPAVEAGTQTTGRRWWLIAGIAAAVAVAAVLGVRGFVRAPRDGHGSITAAQPAHLELGASSAELEAGAEVTWRRDGHRLVVSQPRGVATWRIASDDELVIDAGATVASVEAHGASLRVEVNMNPSDARVIAGSAITAAVVSLVTVVVYEGRVEVSGQGQTVNVVPGNKVAIAPGTPPRTAVAGGPNPGQQALLAAAGELEKQLATCGDGTYDGKLDVTLEVAPDGRSSVVQMSELDPHGDVDLENCISDRLSHATFPKTTTGATVPVRVAWARSCDADALVADASKQLEKGLHAAAHQTLEKALACKPTERTYALAFMAACGARMQTAAREYYEHLQPERRDALAQVCVRNGITLKAPAKTAPKLPPALYSSDVAKVIDDLMPAIRTCAAKGGAITAHLRVQPSGVVAEATAEPASELADCVLPILRGQRFPATQRGGTFSYPFSFKTCDDAKLKADGEAKLTQGLDAAALLDFEAAIKCGGGGDVYVKAFMAACRSRHEAKARQYYKSLPMDRRDSISQVCIRNGITF